MFLFETAKVRIFFVLGDKKKSMLFFFFIFALQNASWAILF